MTPEVLGALDLSSKILPAVATGLFTWLATRTQWRGELRKEREKTVAATLSKPTEVQAAIDNAVERVIAHYERALKRAEERERELLSDIRSLRETVEDQNDKIAEQGRKLDEQSKVISQASSDIERLLAQIKEMEKMLKEAGVEFNRRRSRLPRPVTVPS